MKINILIIYILLKYYIIISITITIITPYPKIKLPSAILTFLPERFTEDDAKHVRTKLGMNIEKTGNMISTWKKRHYVVQMADGSFEKVSLKPQNNE